MLLLKNSDYLFKLNLLIICLLSLTTATTLATTFTNKTCAVTSWQIYNFIAHAQDGASKEQQLKKIKNDSFAVHDLNTVYSIINQHGYAGAYESLHGQIITCNLKVKDKNFEPDYLQCSGRAAMRIHILSDIKNKKTLDYMYKKYGQEFKAIIDMLYQRVNEFGYLSAVKFSASGFATCVEDEVVKTLR